MATHSGILGNFSGKIGPIVGGNWNGISYIRSKPVRRSNTRLSELQLARQAKFALGMRFIQAMGPLVNISYQSGYGKTAKNAALSRLLSQAVGGVYPDLYIDYPAVEIARGELKKAAGAAVDFTADNQLRFTWTDNTGMGTAATTDQAILVAYCPEKNDLIWIGNGGLRGDGEGLLGLQLLMKVVEGSEITLHTWMSFRSGDGKRLADSCYTGVVKVG
jgi:Family of unknown function (DUF6266)